MKIVNPNESFHTLQLIPRFKPCMVLTLYLYNEATQEETIVNLDYENLNGLLFITFDFTFAESERYQFKILQDTDVVYRGKIFATEHESQTYIKDKAQYYYE